MNPIYLFACGYFWSKYGDLRAGSELISGLQSYSPEIRHLSLEMLARRPSASLQLVREALDFGSLLPEDGWQVSHALADSSLRLTPSPHLEMEYKREKHEFSIWIGSDR